MVSWFNCTIVLLAGKYGHPAGSYKPVSSSSQCANVTKRGNYFLSLVVPEIARRGHGRRDTVFLVFHDAMRKKSPIEK